MRYNILRRIASLCLVTVLTFPVLLPAGEKEHLFEQGNAFYQAGDFAQALENYQKILEMGFESGSVYFNMGNCHYKLRNVGQAILYYERARRLIPGDEDLKANLALANLAVVDKITARSEFILFRMWNDFVHLLPFSILLWVTVGLYMATSACIILWVLFRRRTGRLIALRLCVFFCVVLVILGLSLLGQTQQKKHRVEGIIMTQKVDVRSAPSDESMDVFSLHEGTKVRIDQTSGVWVEIILADGKVGWVKKDVVEVI